MLYANEGLNLNLKFCHRLMWKTTPITLCGFIALIPFLDPPGFLSFNWSYYNTLAILLSAILGFLLQWSGALALGYVKSHADILSFSLSNMFGLIYAIRCTVCDKGQNVQSSLFACFFFYQLNCVLLCNNNLTGKV